jgi:hypothetical protein
LIFYLIRRYRFGSTSETIMVTASAAANFGTSSTIAFHSGVAVTVRGVRFQAANTTTPSIKTISYFIEEGSMLGMALEQVSRQSFQRKNYQRVKQETIRSRNRNA